MSENLELTNVVVFAMLQGKMEGGDANKLMRDILQVYPGNIIFSSYVGDHFGYMLKWNYTGKTSEIENPMVDAARNNGVKKMNIAVTIPCINMSKFRYYRTFCCKHVIFTNDIENFDELGEYIKNTFTNYGVTKTEHAGKYKNGFMVKCSNANCGGKLDETLVTNLMKVFPTSKVAAISKCNKNYGFNIWGYLPI